MNAPILISDCRVEAVPIEECKEPLVDLRKYPLLATDRHPVVGYRCETQLYCREGVAERLLEADRLLTGGLRLLIVECHRPVELQERYWRGGLEALRERHPDWSEDRLTRENAKFVAPPWGVPPHSTGGALDVVLVDSSGREPDMGSPINAGGPLSQTAAENRRTLLVAMEAAGFLNYGYEWWHYSYGDRYWAYAKGEPAARYGSV